LLPDQVVDPASQEEDDSKKMSSDRQGYPGLAQRCNKIMNGVDIRKWVICMSRVVDA
jgi:hypothetical protein